MTIILIVFFPNIIFATEKIDVQELTGEIKKYSDENFPELSDENWVSEAISRKYEFEWERYFS